MKIKHLLLLMLMLMLAVLLNVTPMVQASAADDIKVLVNGKALVLDVPPIIEDGRTLLPVRAIAESLGATVDWDFVARRVGVILNKDVVSLIIDSKDAYVNGQLKRLDVPARIVGGRTLAPARFISESLHAEVDWDAAGRTVIITTFVDADPFSTELAQLEAAVLKELNQRRAKVSRAALTPVVELSQMARSHAEELAKAGLFTHESPRFGGTAARAAARGLPVHFEYLAFGLPDAVAIAEGLLRGEHGAQLLAEEAQFIGLGLYKGIEPGNADILAVAELIEGDGFILGPRPRRLETAELIISGYALTGASLTLYLLNSAGEYVSRHSYTLSMDNTGRFTSSISLPQHGRYAAVVGQDSVIVLYE